MWVEHSSGQHVKVQFSFHSKLWPTSTRDLTVAGQVIWMICVDVTVLVSIHLVYIKYMLTFKYLYYLKVAQLLMSLNLKPTSVM